MAEYGNEYYCSREKLNPLQELFGCKPGLLSRLKRMPATVRLLDIGCGTGHFLGDASSRFEVFGLEISRYASTKAAEDPRLLGRICRGNAMDTPYRSGSLQVVTALDIVEHLDQPEAFFKEARRLLAPGGILAVSTPNPGSIGRWLKAERWFGNRDRTHISIRPASHWARSLSADFIILAIWHDGLWDAPYLPGGHRAGRTSAVKKMLNAIESLTIVLPSITATVCGLGIPSRLGENTWILAAARSGGDR